MDILVNYILVPLVAAIVGWFGQKVLTKREARKADLGIINESVTPLLTAQKEILEQNRSLIQKLTEMDDKKRQLQDENKELKCLVRDLTKRVKELEEKVLKLTSTITQMKADADNA
jgi:uncharacterized phage infection (PIP) family protein YhgE